MIDFGFHNMDCLEGMRQMPDKCVDLAIVDPPYGDGGGCFSGSGKSRFGGWFDRYGRDCTDERSYMVHVERERERERRKRGYAAEPQIGAERSDLGSAGDSTGTASRSKNGGIFSDGQQSQHWDVAPPKEYFDELARVSKNQIIWGGNYFDLPPTRCFLVWRKLSISENFSMAMCEYAWTSFSENAKWFEFPPQGNGKKRIHATQKPVELYRWILANYAKDGDIILDTHVGSASSLIACEQLGYKYIGFEINKRFHDAAIKRMADERRQLALDIRQAPQTEQMGLELD